MPSYLVTYEDTSPFFTYSGPWRAGNTSGDPLTDRNSDSTFTTTETQGAAFTFSFYGTEASIHGSKRSNHGRYQVSIDGVTAPVATGFSRDDQFNATLFSGTVPRGTHTVSLVNRDNRFLDIDTVSWVGSVGRDDEQLIVNTRQDSHPDFVYSPPDAWTTAPYSVGTYAAGSGHIPRSLCSAKIQSDAIALFGPAGPRGPATYSVQLANRPATTYSATRDLYRARQLLYYGGGLGPGVHTITMKLESQSNPDQMLAIDYAEIYTAPSLGGNFEGAPLSIPGSIIAGFAVLGTISLLSSLILIAILVFYKMGRFHFGPSKQQMVREVGEHTRIGRLSGGRMAGMVVTSRVYSPPATAHLDEMHGQQHHRNHGVDFGVGANQNQNQNQSQSNSSHATGSSTFSQYIHQNHQPASSATGLLANSASATPPEESPGALVHMHEDPRLAMYINTVNVGQDVGSRSTSGATVNSPQGTPSPAKKTQPVVLQASNATETDSDSVPPPAYNPADSRRNS